MTLRVRQANWLPLPEGAAMVAPTEEEVADLFPKGEVSEFLPHLKCGKIKTQAGIELPFDTNLLEIIPPQNAADIKVGMKVGYDVSRTSSGTRISRMRIY